MRPLGSDPLPESVIGYSHELQLQWFYNGRYVDASIARQPGTTSRYEMELRITETDDEGSGEETVVFAAGTEKAIIEAFFRSLTYVLGDAESIGHRIAHALQNLPTVADTDIAGETYTEPGIVE